MPDLGRTARHTIQCRPSSCPRRLRTIVLHVGYADPPQLSTSVTTIVLHVGYADPRCHVGYGQSIVVQQYDAAHKSRT